MRVLAALLCLLAGVLLVLWWSPADPVANSAGDGVRVAEAGAAASGVEPQPEDPPATPLPRHDVAPRAVDVGVLAGRVRTPGGEAVAGASLSVRRVEGVSAGSTVVLEADDDGRFEFATEQPCTILSISVAPTERTTAVERWLRLRLRPGDRTEIELTAGSGATVRGRVVDGQGAPVARARVLAWHDDPHRIDGRYSVPPQRAVEADDRGHFELRHIGPRFVLSAEADGLLCRTRLRGDVDGRDSIEGLELELAPSAVLHGRLLDSGGEPIPDYRFANHFGSSSSNADQTGAPGVWRARPEHNVTTTAADGTFRIEVVRDHRYLWEVQHPMHPMWRGAHRATDGDLEVQLESGEAVRGRVFAPGGGPADGAVVELNDYPDRRVATGPDGRFELRGAPLAEKHYLAVSMPGAAIHCVQPIGDPEDVRVELTPGLALAGHVVDAGGAPVFDALVEIVGDRQVNPGFRFGGVPTWEWAHGRDRTRTAVDGSFRFEQLYDGEFVVRVHHPFDARLTSETVARSGAEAMRVQLDEAAMRGVVFVGTARDGRTGTPIPSFLVWVTDTATGRGQSYEVEAVDGAFELPGFKSGRYIVAVEAEGFARAVDEARDCEVGEHRFDASMDPVRSLEVRVVEAGGGGAPAELSVFEVGSDQPLWVITSPGSRSLTLDTGRDGRARLEGLPGRALVLQVRSPGADIVRRPLDLSEPPEGPVTVVLAAPPPTVDVHVLVLEMPGAPIELPPAVTEEWLVRALAAGDVAPVEQPVTAELTGIDGKHLSSGDCRVVGREQVGDLWRLALELSMLANVGEDLGFGVTTSSLTAALQLRGERTPMRLSVRAEGYEDAERRLDATAAHGEQPLEVVVVLRRAR